MTIVPWPVDAKKRAPESPIDGILRILLADIPGPPNETPEERAARMDRLFQEAKAMDPRDGTEAMLAAQCLILGLMIDDCQKDAERADLAPRYRRAASQHVRNFETLLRDSRRLLKQCQRRPQTLRTVAPAPVRPAAPLPAPPPVPAPAAAAAPRPVPVRKRKDDIHLIEEARSGVIVPLHPAPKTLQ